MRPGPLAIMAVLLVVAACQTGGRQPALLFHDEPTAVDHGHQYWAGLLTFSESGECLQLREVYEDGRVETRPTATGGVFRPVWPSGYRPEPADGGISVLDANGRVVASTGDIIRIGGRIRAKNPVALADEIPPDCRLLAQKLVGRDVTVITNSEASVLGAARPQPAFPQGANPTGHQGLQVARTGGLPEASRQLSQGRGRRWARSHLAAGVRAPFGRRGNNRGKEFRGRDHSAHRGLD